MSMHKQKLSEILVDKFLNGDKILEMIILEQKNVILVICMLHI